jgi:glucosamine-6-phosphate deaminase
MPESKYEQMSLKAAQAVAEQLKAKPNSCFGLPTGRTPVRMYELLSEWSARGELDWSQACCFGLDEYLEMTGGESYAAFLEKHLYSSTNLPNTSRYTPADCDNYDELIASHGGLDITLIGVGVNGHIAFNEPGTFQASWTHCVWLTESTRRANAEFFDSLQQVPYKAVTMGIQTILSSRKIIVLASGEAKKSVLLKAQQLDDCSDLPLCWAFQRPDIQVLADFDVPTVRK